MTIPTVADSFQAMPNRGFGRFELRRLLGKSERSMAWLAVDSRSGAEVMLCLPRTQPHTAQALAAWLVAARRAARLDHPQLAPVVDCGSHERWPFIAVARRLELTLGEWLAEHPNTSLDDGAGWIASILRGLAFAHDAGIAHFDLQPHHILINERGQASVAALGVAHASPVPQQQRGQHPFDAARSMPLDPFELAAHRDDAERDVLACGLLLYGLVAGEPALGSRDIGVAIDRLAPLGRELVRLPWTTPHPLPEALRAIVNRSTAGQLRLRYRNARTFLGALEGWREAAAQDDGGPVALLLGRLHSVGHLPALPGLALRVQRVTAIESERTDEIARHLLPDMALSLELLRMLNTAQVQGTQIAGNGAVLTLRRVVALIGVNGVRQAANSLRTWPGPLDEEDARALHATIERTRLAGHAAQALRPAGYDGEVVYLIAMMQNLGRLLLRYHFADEAEQIQQLMRPSLDDAGVAGPDHAGLGEDAAAYAVLGVDVEAFGFAVARQWGLGEEVLHMMRRLPADAPVRKPDNDADLLRCVASAANEAIDAVSQLPANRVGAALGSVAQRYARVLRIDTKAIVAAVKEARDAMRTGAMQRPSRRTGHDAGATDSSAAIGAMSDSEETTPLP